MGLPAYIATNLITAADVVDTGSADATYPINYIKDRILGTTTRFTGGVGVAIAHFTASPFVNYDSLFVGNHNVVSGTGSISLGSGSSSPGGSEPHGATFRNENTFIDLSTVSGLSQNQAYLGIQFYLGGATDDVEVGEIVVGPRVLFPRDKSGINPPGKDFVNTGVTIESIGGQQWPYEFSKYKVFTVNFSMVPESELAAFLAFNDAVNQDPFVYIPDVSTTEAYYVRKDRGFHPRVRSGMWKDGSSLAPAYDISFTFRTESEGLSV